MGEFLYNFLIYPIYLFIEVFFTLLFSRTENILLSVFTVSLIINIIILPVCIYSNKIYKENLIIKNKLQSKIDSIKKNFKGNEKIFLLNELYKKNNYSLFFELKPTLYILLQIPFFIASCIFFSQLLILDNVSLWRIQNVLQPDNLIHINNLTFNILPIIMTFISIISTEIYIKTENDNKKRLSMYLTAFVFLIVLYNTSALLVLYWICNNIISLIKNIILYIGKNKFIKFINLFNFSVKFNKLHIIIFLISSLILVIYSSFFITIIAKSPKSFLITESFNYLYNQDILECFVISLGFFFLYPLIIYLFCPKFIKYVFSIIIEVFMLSGFFNYFISSGDKIAVNYDFGIYLYQELFDKSLYQNCLSILFFLLCLCVIIVAFKKNKLQNILILNIAILLSLSIVSIYKFIDFKVINLDETRKINIKNTQITKDSKTIRLSKNGKNIILIFMDSLSGYYLKTLLEDESQIREKFIGFKHYTDSVSLFARTSASLPSLLGGYNYSPMKIANHNSAKINVQAFFMLPVILSANNFDTYNTDGVFNFNEDSDKIPDYDKNIIYNSFTKDSFLYNVKPNFNRLKNFQEKNILPKTIYIEKRNAFLFSIFLMLPQNLKHILYEPTNISSNYLEPNIKVDKRTCLYTAVDYSKLYYLPEITTVDSEKNTYCFIYDSLAHDEILFFDYLKKYNISSTTIKKCIEKSSYNSFVTAILLLSDYVTFLKDSGVYDNTKIIIVSDHGFREGDKLADGKFYPTDNSIVLLYKDFNKKGKMCDDNTYMMSADVPSLALENVVKKPVDPFNNNEIYTLSTKEKNNIPVCGALYTCYYNVHSIEADKKLWKDCELCNKERDKLYHYDIFFAGAAF